MRKVPRALLWRLRRGLQGDINLPEAPLLVVRRTSRCKSILLAVPWGRVKRFLEGLSNDVD